MAIYPHITTFQIGGRERERGRQGERKRKSGRVSLENNCTEPLCNVFVMFKENYSNRNTILGPSKEIMYDVIVH